MSHFTRIKTQMVEQEYLLTALRQLGYEVEEGPTKIRGWGAGRMPVDIRVSTGRRGYDIGFRKAGDHFECVADWWGVRGVRRNQFLQQVAQRYAYHATCAKLKEQGFDVVEEEEEKDGRIHLVLRRIA